MITSGRVTLPSGTWHWMLIDLCCPPQRTLVARHEQGRGDVLQLHHVDELDVQALPQWLRHAERTFVDGLGYGWTVALQDPSTVRFSQAGQMRRAPWPGGAIGDMPLEEMAALFRQSSARV